MRFLRGRTTRTSLVLARSQWVIPLLIILIALIPRFIYLSQIEASHPLFYNLLEGADPRVFDQWAKELSRGDIQGNDKLLYTSFMSLIYRFAENDLYALCLAQVLMGSLTCLLLYYVGNLLFGKKVGLVAAILSALYSPFIFYEGTILIVTMQVFLMSLLMLFLALAVKHRHFTYYLAAGLVVGLMSIDRGNILFFVPFFILGTITSYGRREKIAWGYIASFLAGIFLIQLSLHALHLLLTGTWPVETSPMGVHFYRGNAYGASGQYSPLSHLAPVSPGQSYLLATWKGIEAQPGAWLKLMCRKTLLFLNRYEIPNNYSLEYSKRFFPILRYLLHYGIIAPLGLAGAFLGYKKQELRLFLLLALSYAVSIIIFFVISRYRLPILPVLILLASYFLVNMRNLWRIGRGKPVKNEFIRSVRHLSLKGSGTRIVFLIVLIGLFYLVNRNANLTHANSPYNWGCAYLQSGNYIEAITHFREAILLYPKYAKAYNNLGNCYLEMKEIDQALTCYQKAVSLKPENATYHNNMALAYVEKGEWEKAISQHRIAIQLNPNYDKARFDLGRLYLRMGEEEKARETFREF